MMPRISPRLSGFFRNERGSLTIEFVIIVPILIWAIAGLFVFVSAFQLKVTATKATYTVSDLISRQTTAVDQDFMDGLQAVFAYLAGPNTNGRLRVSLLRCTENCNKTERKLALDWSKGVGGASPITDATLNTETYKKIIPTAALGERLIMLETRVDFHPPVKVGLPDQAFDTIMVSRPRFAPQICWISCS
ncbi:hypothetical protein CCR83_09055 [Rhodobacter veldkampii DSM 11550]|uniref:TadE-like domain-containing protein n=1 Tax=Phaeovulum veldkampii DSM 11550 TaxID=1185920 RepID=A0A2T4JLR4_9RHOB|nr:TadE/TadG family type IV pilus assembly protein [Phaeovulum veldkampii]MBK5946574.1 hypothetical protein [Phaeovulum veldkampii DSM 11550]PTE18860.1 hypothetical protein C5F46_03065 [Phaeovulum veldkampii DSM 11550]TDQ59906.1 TadE-like protein [Phaeovulum veldkampii DSM 11550]